jgi:hypothetical protein
MRTAFMLWTTVHTTSPTQWPTTVVENHHINQVLAVLDPFQGAGNRAPHCGFNRPLGDVAYFLSEAGEDATIDPVVLDFWETVEGDEVCWTPVQLGRAFGVRR